MIWFSLPTVYVIRKMHLIYFSLTWFFCISETGICIEIISTIPEASWIPRCWVNTKNYKAVFRNSNLVFRKPYLDWNRLSGHWLLFYNQVFCFYVKGHWFSIWEMFKTQIHEKYWFSYGKIFNRYLIIFGKIFGRIFDFS